MSIFTKIAEKYDWKIIGEPVCLSGGFMHKMYKISTQLGVFALKLLNPFVMQRETAMDNYAKAERIELLLEQQGIPILPALSFYGRKMQEIDGEYFYLFDYFPGKALKSNEIKATHCKEMGKVLAEIHSIDKKYENETFYEMSIDWN
uniref:phosphotransferase n=1 Tax=Eubacterium sp. TaxID=142586 RepID=UPI003FEF9E94